jgi:hypothetical protein
MGMPNPTALATLRRVAVWLGRSVTALCCSASSEYYENHPLPVSRRHVPVSLVRAGIGVAVHTERTKFE